MCVCVHQCVKYWLYYHKIHDLMYKLGIVCCIFYVYCLFIKQATKTILGLYVNCYKSYTKMLCWSYGPRLQQGFVGIGKSTVMVVSSQISPPKHYILRTLTFRSIMQHLCWSQSHALWYNEWHFCLLLPLLNFTTPVDFSIWHPRSAIFCMCSRPFLYVFQKCQVVERWNHCRDILAVVWETFCKKSDLDVSWPNPLYSWYFNFPVMWEVSIVSSKTCW